MTVTLAAPTSYVVARYALAVYAEPVTVGANVRRLRELAGMSTQTTLAERMGVPQSRVSDLENDRYVLPDTKTLMLAATAIGCRVDDLLAGVDPDYDAKKTMLTAEALGDQPRRQSRHVKRALSLLAMMSDDGQREAAGLLSTLVRAFPRQPSEESAGPGGGKPADASRKARGKR